MSLRNLDDLAFQRLVNQSIASPGHTQTPFQQPADVVAHLGAMQAQDYSGVKWSVGLRLPGSCEADIDQALAEGKIIRTWLMRGTLHLVATEDIRWMLALLGPLTNARQAARRKQLGLDAAYLARGSEALARAMQGGKPLTRKEVAGVLEQAGLDVGSPQVNHLLYSMALDGLICLVPLRGKQPSYGLLDEWVPPAPGKTREEALVELARRYFTSRGPATLKDFAWWAGLPVVDARAALNTLRAELIQEDVQGQVYWRAPVEPVSVPERGAVYLLPSFDECLLGYADRSASLDPDHLAQWMGIKNGLFPATIMNAGRVIGFWRRTLQKDAVLVEASPFAPLNLANSDSFVAAIRRYGDFLRMKTEVSFSD